MADASRHRGVTDKKVWKTDNKGRELYGGGRWHVACYRMRGVKFMHGRPPQPSFLCSSQESSRHASAWRKDSSQPKDLG